VKRLPVRNLWSLEPGECIVAEEILERLKDCEVYFPAHDVGVDLLVVKGEKHVGIQVKESRYYVNRRWRRGHVGYSWHSIKKAKFLKRKADFYIFLTYLPVVGEHKISRFENKFLIVPSAELERRMTVKDSGKNQIYSFCFHFEDGKVWDERVTVPHNELTTYDEFVDAWHLIE
jgi:hypothetical protein